MNPQAILDFWFGELEPEQWWRVDPALDAQIRQRFETTHVAATRAELWPWRDTALGRLAEVIVLDQFSRNLHRGDPRAFAADPLALALAQEAVRAGADRTMSPAQRDFLYMPFMHSESLAIHEIALKLFSQPGQESQLAYELKHRAVLQRFGRYPHRNAILGRASTPEEREFLKQAGSSF